MTSLFNSCGACSYGPGFVSAVAALAALAIASSPSTSEEDDDEECVAPLLSTGNDVDDGSETGGGGGGGAASHLVVVVETRGLNVVDWDAPMMIICSIAGFPNIVFYGNCCR
jgi:hypothetical protein